MSPRELSPRSKTCQSTFTTTLNSSLPSPSSSFLVKTYHCLSSYQISRLFMISSTVSSSCFLLCIVRISSILICQFRTIYYLLTSAAKSSSTAPLPLTAKTFFIGFIITRCCKCWVNSYSLITCTYHIGSCKVETQEGSWMISTWELRLFWFFLIY